MKSKEQYPKDVFISLKDLLGMEQLAQYFSLLSNRKKVKSILSGKHASKLRGRGLDFEEVRNYVKGDDIRNIDWKVTARTQKTHTRVFSEEKEKPALIIVDQSKTMFFGSKKSTKSVVAAKIAAMAAFRILKMGDRIGGIVFADHGIDIVYPKRDRRNILRFLEKIVKRNRELLDSTPISFEDALKETFQKTKNIVGHDFTIVVISDFLRYSPKVIEFIIQMSQHNDIILAKVYDELERDIPSTNFMASSSNLQISIKGSQKSIRDKFSIGFDSDYKSFEATMKRHRIPLFTINTVDSLESQLKSIFIGDIR